MPPGWRRALPLVHGVGVREKQIHFRPAQYSLHPLACFDNELQVGRILTKDSNELLAQDWRVQPGLGQNFPKELGLGKSVMPPQPFGAGLPGLHGASYRLTWEVSKPSLALLCNSEGVGVF